MNHFLILLYKDFIIRKRHYIITSCELILPVLFACIPLILLTSYNEKPNILMINKTFDEYFINEKSWPHFEPYKYHMKNSFEAPSEFKKNVTLHLFYTPFSLTTHVFMKAAKQLFEVKTGFTGITMRGAENESQLDTLPVIYHAYPMKMVAVIFNNIKNESKLPENLNYTLRCGDMNYINTFKTDKVLRHKKTDFNPYKETSFIGWQAAIEQTFIKFKSDEHNAYGFSVFLNSFPNKSEKFSSLSMKLLQLFPLLFSFGFLIFAAILTCRITSEKANGMQVLMRTMGLSRFTYWISSFTNYFLPGVIMSFIISMIYKNPPFEEMYVLKKTEFTVLWLLILVFITNLILFCFVITIFFDNPRYSVVLIVILHLVIFSLFFYYFFGYHTASMGFSNASKLFLCVLPLSSLFYSFHFIFYLETNGRSIYWFHIMNYGQSYYFELSFIVNGNIISFITLIIMLWYLDAIWPFQDRVSQPLYFPFTVNYWFGSWVNKKSLENRDFNLDPKFFEPELSGVYPGIVIQNLTKRFDTIWSSKTVIDNLSFKIYSKQITILLGHNKTGKTTLLKILSGLSKPSHGKVFINGWDLYSSLTRIRKYLGVCPQSFVLYEALTVHEHFQIFAGLKGVKLQEINEQTVAMHHLLLLNAHKDDLSITLSNEVKRMLNLGMALIGNSTILLLDEPTKYMSSEERYHFWSVLFTMKEKRTILLTSSCVGDICNFEDRIAFFGCDKLLFCGSSEFLKQKLDVGYKLHIMKDFPFEIDEVLMLIQKYYHEASLEKETESFAIINFNSETNVRLGSMFEELESIKNEIGVKSFGITQLTMEDVFMNEPYITFLKNGDTELKIINEKNACEEDLFDMQRYVDESWNLCWSRLKGLFYKRAHYMYRLWGLFAFSILIPSILMSFCFILLEGYHKSEYSPLYLNLNTVYGDSTFGFIETYSNKTTTSQSIIQNELLTVMEENFISVYTHGNVKELSQLYGFTHYPTYSTGFLVGGSAFENNHSEVFIAWYNSDHHHTAPIALNLMHTAILRHVTGNGTICLTNHPLLPYNYKMASNYDNIETQKTVILAIVPLVLAFIGASYTLIPIYENTSKAKLMQLMSGLSLKLYWFSMILWDILMHIGVCLFLLLTTFLFQSYYFFDYGSYAAIYSIFFIFGWCTVPIAYLISLVSSRPIVAFVYLLLFYAITGLISYVVLSPKIYTIEVVAWIFRIFPSFTATEGFLKIFLISLNNSFCYEAKDVLDNICYSRVADKISPIFKCCCYLYGEECEDYQDFISFHFEKGILREFMIMFILGSLVFIFLTLLETAIYQSYKGLVHVKPFTEAQFRKYANIIFSGVFAEKERIEDALANGNYDETLMVIDLTKYYGSLCTANSLTFGVIAGESFGIIGGYRAGKSSIFKMLAGEIVPTAGNAFIKEKNLVNDLKQFQSYVGYCPQYDALLNHLTGREILRFFSKLRGIVGQDKALLKMVEMGDEADELIKYYSVVNKRKLAVATAIIGLPPVLMFDEPTTGLELKFKRIIWDLFSKIKTCNYSAIIFSSTSILECQELYKMGLCTRLAVMDDGIFQCLGSIQDLEKKYNSGKIVKMLLKLETLDFTHCIFEVKGFFETNVPKVTLLKYHEGIFVYHVGESFLTLSALFHLMDYMKMRFNFYKYFINDSSLSKVCYTFTEGTRKNQCF